LKLSASRFPRPPRGENMGGVTQDFPPESESPTRLSSDFITPEELVERYRGRISLRTLSNWRYANRGPKYHRLGNRILYKLDDVLEWESRQARGERG